MDGSVGDVAFFRMKYPINPEIKEAARMEIFASVWNSGSENASKDIKMDMVNPIPPRKQTPHILPQVTLDGRVASPSRTARYDKPTIPIICPPTRPAIMPALELHIKKIARTQ